MLSGTPDRTAAIRLLTIRPNGMRRRRKAMSSVMVTLAPENKARR